MEVMERRVDGRPAAEAIAVAMARRYGGGGGGGNSDSAIVIEGLGRPCILHGGGQSKVTPQSNFVRPARRTHIRTVTPCKSTHHTLGSGKGLA